MWRFRLRARARRARVLRLSRLGWPNPGGVERSISTAASTCPCPVGDLTSNVVLIANMVVASRTTTFRLAGAAGARAYAEIGAIQNAVHSSDRSMSGCWCEPSGGKGTKRTKREGGKQSAADFPR